jgi:hypothetical protein
MKKRKNIIGAWAFLIGIVLALVVGLLSDIGSDPIILGILVGLGIIVGLLNISGKETKAFLISGIVLIIASAFGAGVMSAIPKAVDILGSLMTIFIPATIVVSIKNVFIMAKN